MFRYYFDAALEKCQEFMYEGCKVYMINNFSENQKTLKQEDDNNTSVYFMSLQIGLFTLHNCCVP